MTGENNGNDLTANDLRKGERKGRTIVGTKRLVKRSLECGNIVLSPLSGAQVSAHYALALACMQNSSVLAKSSEKK